METQYKNYSNFTIESFNKIKTLLQENKEKLLPLSFINSEINMHIYTIKSVLEYMENEGIIKKLMSNEKEFYQWIGEFKE